jgi:hypothetical protein
MCITLICIFLSATFVEAKSIPWWYKVQEFFKKIWNATVGKVWNAVVFPVINYVIGPEGVLNQRAPDPAMYQVIPPGGTLKNPDGTDAKDAKGKVIENNKKEPVIVVHVDRNTETGQIESVKTWKLNSPGGQGAAQIGMQVAAQQQRYQDFYGHPGGDPNKPSRYEKMFPSTLTPTDAAKMAATSFIPGAFPTSTVVGTVTVAMYDVLSGKSSPPTYDVSFDPNTAASFFPGQVTVEWDDGNGGEVQMNYNEQDAQTILNNNPGAHVVVPEGTTTSVTYSDSQLPGQLIPRSTTYVVTAGPTDASGNTQFRVDSYTTPPMEFYNHVSPTTGTERGCSFTCGNGVRECGEQCDIDIASASWANNKDCPQDNTPICSGPGGHLSQVRGQFGDCDPLLQCTCQSTNYSIATCNPGICGAECTPNENDIENGKNSACSSQPAGKQSCGNDCMCGSLCGNGALDAGEECEVDSDCKRPGGTTPDSNKKCVGCLCVDKTFCGDLAVQNPNDYSQAEECEPQSVTINVVRQLLGDYVAELKPMVYLYSFVGYTSPFGPMGQCTVGCLSCTGECKYNFSVQAAAPNPTEICGDNIDNNCNGQIDELCSCNVNETRACGASSGMLSDVGICKHGTMTCVNESGGTSGGTGHWGLCLGGFWPLMESPYGFNGLDDDCDGLVDDCVIPVSPTGCMDEPLIPILGRNCNNSVSCPAGSDCNPNDCKCYNNTIRAVTKAEWRDSSGHEIKSISLDEIGTKEITAYAETSMIDIGTTMAIEVYNLTGKVGEIGIALDDVTGSEKKGTLSITKKLYSEDFGSFSSIKPSLGENFTFKVYQADQRLNTIKQSNTLTITRLVVDNCGAVKDHNECRIATPLGGCPATIKGCGNILTSECYWEQTAATCRCNNTVFVLNGAFGGTCKSWIEDKGACENGQKTVDKKTEFTAGTCDDGKNGESFGCKNETDIFIPCGKALIALPFTGILQLIAAVVLIILIYLFMRWRFFRKKAKTRKR